MSKEKIPKEVRKIARDALVLNHLRDLAEVAIADAFGTGWLKNKGNTGAAFDRGDFTVEEFVAAFERQLRRRVGRR